MTVFQLTARAGVGQRNIEVQLKRAHHCKQAYLLLKRYNLATRVCFTNTQRSAMLTVDVRSWIESELKREATDDVSPSIQLL
jgi:hypothetical protein